MPAAVVDQVLAGDLEAVRAAVKDLPEVDRRRLARSAIRLLRDVTDHTYFDRDTRHELADAYIKHNRGKVWPYQGERARVRECAEVLALATVTPSEFRKFGAGFLPSDELALETLINRSTDLEGFVDAIADDTPRRWNSRFRLMRSLVQAGRIGAPANPGYILHMINAFGGRHPTIYDDLKADSTGLLEEEACSKRRVQARPVSPPTTSILPTHETGARRLPGCAPKGSYPAAVFSMPASRPCAATSRRFAPVGFRGFTNGSSQRKKSDASVLPRTSRCSRARCRPRSRSRSARSHWPAAFPIKQSTV